ncbi:cytochrome d ubiquinol oxidase subunit II [Acidocella aquatica]|uniref:Cytochrome d ubiquinol oxidase subunit II n=1 Tax=Acidocella aquatica TaxID=1922313 RepID=A0ABQ6A525_9PROT|nr:cytochrome d ubiquinol oxidase subunit II [Acidocella aquatica]GLR65956.1 cytochrome d ubiquinol oxidase subunit II [Acidocella aquatica]
MEIYVALKIIWAVLLGVLLTGLAVMVGMDMGVGTLLRFVGKNDAERRTALNIIGPHWDGNQVWFILGGGAIFAAFPTLYATSFSVFYVVMILLLFSMIMRPVAFEYRSKVDTKTWRGTWDWAFLISGAVPMIVYGAAFGNVLEGVGFHYGWTGQYYQDESFLSYLLNPFAVMCGVMSLSLSIYQGGTFLMLRGVEPIYSRARLFATCGGLLAAVIFAVGGLWVSHLNGYVFTGAVNPGMEATPLGGPAVAVQAGAWLNNYHSYPILWLAPVLGFVGMLVGTLALRLHLKVLAWWLGAVAWAGTISTVGIAMFPFLMPSSTNPSQSLTVWNSTGSAYNLGWMLFFAVVFVPVILSYTSWAFYVMRGKVKTETVVNDPHSY